MGIQYLPGCWLNQPIFWNIRQNGNLPRVIIKKKWSTRKGKGKSSTPKCRLVGNMLVPSKVSHLAICTLQEINISHLGKRKIIFKMPFWGDMLVSWRVFFFFRSWCVKEHKNHQLRRPKEVCHLSARKHTESHPARFVKYQLPHILQL